MIKPSDLVGLFVREHFQSLTLQDDGNIKLTVKGCLHATAQTLFSEFGSVVFLQDDDVTKETWLLIPTPLMRTVLVTIFVSAWRLHTAQVNNPWMTFGNVNSDTTGWGDTHPTNEQCKTALNLLCLKMDVRVYHNQEEGLGAAYGSPLTAGEGYIAVQVNEKVIILSPSGYISATNLEVVD